MINKRGYETKPVTLANLQVYHLSQQSPSGLTHVDMELFVVTGNCICQVLMTQPSSAVDCALILSNPLHEVQYTHECLTLLYVLHILSLCCYPWLEYSLIYVNLYFSVICHANYYTCGL